MPETTNQYDAVTGRLLDLAQEEARGFNHPYIGAEHLVLAMLHEGQGTAAKTLLETGLTLARFRAGVEMAVGRGSVPVEGPIDLTPRTRHVVDRIPEEAAARGDIRIDTGHLLLALLHDGGGLASKLFGQLGIESEALIARVEELLDGDGGGGRIA
jgi:ATP-dependent Clp protease ATP-binding subunit ClpC